MVSLNVYSKQKTSEKKICTLGQTLRSAMIVCGAPIFAASRMIEFHCGYSVLSTQYSALDLRFTCLAPASVLFGNRAGAKQDNDHGDFKFFNFKLNLNV